MRGTCTPRVYTIKWVVPRAPRELEGGSFQNFDRSCLHSRYSCFLSEDALAKKAGKAERIQKGRTHRENKRKRKKKQEAATAASSAKPKKLTEDADANVQSWNNWNDWNWNWEKNDWQKKSNWYESEYAPKKEASEVPEASSWNKWS